MATVGNGMQQGLNCSGGEHEIVATVLRREPQLPAAIPSGPCRQRQTVTQGREAGRCWAAR